MLEVQAQVSERNGTGMNVTSGNQSSTEAEESPGQYIIHREIRWDMGWRIIVVALTIASVFGVIMAIRWKRNKRSD